MKFTAIQFLFLIWVIPVLVLIYIYGLKKRSSVLKKFTSASGLRAIVQDGCLKRRIIKAGLILICLIFIISALTGPKYGYKWQEIETKGVDIIVALDCSKSMLASDISPTRLDRAKREIIDLLNMLKGDRVGLTAFSGTAFLQCPLTVDYQAFYLFLNALSPDFFQIGGTDIHNAIFTAVSGFNQKDNSEKAVILITDGENTGKNPLEAAEEAKKAGIKIFCIGVGKTSGVPIPLPEGGFKKDSSGNIVLTKLDELTLKKIAVVTNGIYVRSEAGDMDLDAIYTQEIRKKMHSSTLGSGKKRIWEDRYQWFLGLALIFLIIEIFIPSVKKTAVSIIIISFLLIFPCTARADKGIEAYQSKQYQAALKHFLKDQIENPEKPELFYNIGDAYYKLGDFKSAEKSFIESLKTENNKLKQKVFYNLGNTKYRQNMLQDAVAAYKESLKIDTNDIDAKKNLEFVKKQLEKQKQNQQNSNKDKQRKPKNKKPESKKPESQKAGQKQQNQNLKQAQRMLNRLEDSPGKAMLPRQPEYMRYQVEKDW